MMPHRAIMLLVFIACLNGLLWAALYYGPIPSQPDDIRCASCIATSLLITSGVGLALTQVHPDGDD